ncbi:MAG: hypothetical protein AB2A00_22670 [Myxococcota bacterium]
MQLLSRLTLVALVLVPVVAAGWGGRGHREMAQRTLDALSGDARKVFDPLRDQIVDAIMAPDISSSEVPGERPRHYLDLEALGLPLPDVTREREAPDVSRSRRQALLATLRERAPQHPREGTLPLALDEVYAGLVDALRRNDRATTVTLTADLLHYLADAHQPLHATDAYDGLSSGGKGVHHAFETDLLDRCVQSRPEQATRAPIQDETAAEVAMQALLESHTEAATVLATDLGCRSPRPGAHAVCRGPVPTTRAREKLKCMPLSRLARERLELAAGRAAALLTRAVEQSRR